MAAGVWIEKCEPHGSRKRHYAFEVALRANPAAGRRPANSGRYGAEDGGGYEVAATYDEWGYWLDRLFELDPNAILGQWESRERMHRYWPKDNPRISREAVAA